MARSPDLAAPRTKTQALNAVQAKPFNWDRAILVGSYLGLVVVTLAVYGQMARGVFPAPFPQGEEFAFIGLDDGDYFTQNPHIKRGLTIEGVRWAFAENFSANWHPLTWTSLMLDSQLYQGRPGGPHVTNLLLHLGSVLLLFTLLRRMTGQFWPSLLASALWAVHPLHVESVSWVSERKDTLSTFFAIGALVAYERYARRPTVWRYLIVMAAYFCSLLSKQMWVTFPCVLILIDYWPLARLRLHGGNSASRYPPVTWRFLALEKVPFFLMALGFAGMIFVVQRNAGAVASLEGMPVSLRLANVVISYWIYIYKTFWPTRLAVMYPLPPGGYSWPIVAGAAVPLVLISVAAIVGWKRWPWLIVGWLWYLGTLVPVIGLVHIGSQAWADRYAYVPHIGLFIALVWSAAAVVAWMRELYGSKLVSYAAAAVAIAVVAAMTVRGHQQVALWVDTETLFKHTVAVTENNYGMVTTLASYLDGTDKLDEAKHYFRMAIDMNSNRPEALIACAGCILNRNGDVDEAIMLLKKALKVDPTNADAHVNLGMAYIRQEKFDEAEKYIRRAPELNKRKSSYAYVALAIAESNRKNADGNKVDQYIKQAVAADDTDPVALRTMASLCMQKGDFKQAEEICYKVLRYSPDDLGALLDLGVLEVRQGNIDEAMRRFRDAVHLRPNSPEARNRLAGGLAAQGRVTESIVEYENAIRLRNDSAEPINDLAWILATDESPGIRKGRRAIELAEQACKLTKRKDAAMLDTLAAAYAEVGRWDDALKTTDEGKRRARSVGNESLAADIEKHEALYMRKQAWREPSQAAAEAVRVKPSTPTAPAISPTATTSTAR